MIIDTDKVSNWIKLHSMICVPIATGFLSWYGALRWQVAFTANEFPLMVFYFFVCAISGVITALLVIQHLTRLGLFDV